MKNFNNTLHQRKRLWSRIKHSERQNGNPLVKAISTCGLGLAAAIAVLQLV